MDKRRLMLRNNSLHKDMEQINQSTQENTSFHEERFMDIRSSTLKPINIHSKGKDDSLSKSRKRNFYETENYILETDEVASKVLKRTSMSKQHNSQVSNASNLKSQQKILSRSNILMTNKSLEEPDNIQSRLHSNATNPSDISCGSPSKVCHESSKSLKPITKPQVSQRKQQDKAKEFQSSVERHKIYNKESEDYVINTKECLPERQNIHVSSVFSSFLQKCCIKLSADGIHTLGVPPSIAKRKMKKILSSKQYQKKDVIDSIEEYIRNEKNFEKMLNDMETSTDNNGFGVLSKVTLARILLEVSEIQADIYNIFISKLNESLLLA